MPFLNSFRIISTPTGSAVAAPRNPSRTRAPDKPFKIDPLGPAPARVDGGPPRRRIRSARRVTSAARPAAPVERLADRPAPIWRRPASPEQCWGPFRSEKRAQIRLCAGRPSARYHRIRSARRPTGPPGAAPEVGRLADRIGRCRRLPRLCKSVGKHFFVHRASIRPPRAPRAASGGRQAVGEARSGGGRGWRRGLPPRRPDWEFRWPASQRARPAKLAVFS